MTLFGNGVLVPGMRMVWPLFEKSPFSSAVVGRLTRVPAVCWRMRRHSSPAKKKSLFFLIGPPTSQPKSLKRSWVLFGEKKLRASSASLRKYSKRPPWKLLVPFLVEILKAAPVERPYSAEKFEV